MELIPAQLAQYGRDGFLTSPDLFTPAEIAALRFPWHGNRLDLAQAPQHLPAEKPNAAFRLGMRHEAAAADHGEATEAVGLTEIHDLPMDAVRVAGRSP
jgi:hypothetical protein